MQQANNPTRLFACPMCGADKGYMLRDGSTYRWWLVSCTACGELVAECRSDRNTSLSAPKPARDIVADEAWNTAGQYAENLRNALGSALMENFFLRNEIANLKARDIQPSRADCTQGRGMNDQQLQSLRNMGNEFEDAADEIDALRADADRYRWLRDKSIHWLDRTLDWDRLDNASLGAAIDAALTQEDME